MKKQSAPLLSLYEWVTRKQLTSTALLPIFLHHWTLDTKAISSRRLDVFNLSTLHALIITQSIMPLVLFLVKTLFLFFNLHRKIFVIQIFIYLSSAKLWFIFKLQVAMARRSPSNTSYCCSVNYSPAESSEPGCKQWIHLF